MHTAGWCTAAARQGSPKSGVHDPLRERREGDPGRDGESTSEVCEGALAQKPPHHSACAPPAWGRLLRSRSGQGGGWPHWQSTPCFTCIVKNGNRLHRLLGGTTVATFPSNSSYE
eukprot:26845-Pyramimonas_sp.AAC.1